ncbi:MAG: hypothetical protein QF463_11470 [Vicinamibacterales bacterium]|nr:hypothetical protein [Vicinamibacterales bacterium]MDP6609676.1 hypothetical protein [Vicinamibacterales bacterium]
MPQPSGRAGRDPGHRFLRSGLVVLVLGAAAGACAGRLPVDINVAGGSQTLPPPAATSPTPDVKPPPRVRPPSDPSIESHPPVPPMLAGHWVGALSLQTCETTVADEAWRTACAASVGQVAPFEMTLEQSRDSVTGVSAFLDLADSVTGSVDAGGIFQFTTGHTTDGRSRGDGLTVIERFGAFTVSGQFVRGHYVVVTTRTESPAGVRNGRTTRTWRVVSLDRM